MAKRMSREQSEKLVLDLLKQEAAKKNPITFDYEAITQATGYSVSTVYRIIHSLEEQGYIRVDKVAYQQKPNLWVFDDINSQGVWSEQLQEIEEVVQRLDLLVKQMKSSLNKMVHENNELRQTIAIKDKEINDIKAKLSNLRDIL